MSSNSTTSSRSSGLGLFTVLGIIFIVLKLTHVINWSWWLVTLPLWAGYALFAAVALLVLLFAMLAALFGGRR